MNMWKLIFIYTLLVFYIVCFPLNCDDKQDKAGLLDVSHQIHQMEIVNYLDLFEEFVPMTTKLVLMISIIMFCAESSFRKHFRTPVRKTAFWGAKHRTQTPRGNLTDEHMFCII